MKKWTHTSFWILFSTLNFFPCLSENFKLAEGGRNVKIHLAKCLFFVMLITNLGLKLVLDFRKHKLKFVEAEENSENLASVTDSINMIHKTLMNLMKSRKNMQTG